MTYLYNRPSMGTFHTFTILNSLKNSMNKQQDQDSTKQYSNKSILINSYKTFCTSTLNSEIIPYKDIMSIVESLLKIL